MRIDWQRGKFTATLEAQDFRMDWRGFLAAVRVQIPSRHRDYIADKKAWVIKERYAPLVESLAREFLTPAVEAAKEPIQPPTTGASDSQPAGQAALLAAPPDDGSAAGHSASVAVAVPPPEGRPHDVAPEDLPVRTGSQHAAGTKPSHPLWPFFLLSLSFAAIGLWFAWNSLPPVRDYFILELGVFPVFQSVFFAASSFAGIGCSFYALGLLLRRR